MRKEAANAGHREEQQAEILREAHSRRVQAARKLLPDYDEVVGKADFRCFARTSPACALNPVRSYRLLPRLQSARHAGACPHG